jgi:hypothetical protein
VASVPLPCSKTCSSPIRHDRVSDRTVTARRNENALRFPRLRKAVAPGHPVASVPNQAADQHHDGNEARTLPTHVRTIRGLRYPWR